MKFCLMINTTQYWQAGLVHALALAQSIISQGHILQTVFFYGQSVKVIEHPELYQAWQRLNHTTEHTSEHTLLLCNTMLEQHHLTDKAKHLDSFKAVSMGSWIVAMEKADKTVEIS